jgi:acetyl-CoA carboxylase biotin carboxylase subunit
VIKKILIANRSEIACRIINACKELNIKTLAVYSEADSNALHVQSADEAVLIGPAPAGQSYLNQEKLIETAIANNCDAIHPGYGFLSENSEFNKKVRAAGLIFIGPNPEAMSLLGSKVESRNTMIDANIPVVPGMKGSSKELQDFKDIASNIGFPVLIKASAGGGGKGMRVVYEDSKLDESLNSAMRESLSAFGSDEVFIEKYIESPRHIEFQVVADNYGNAVHLFERECSIQRRHQKIIEETPSMALSPELRKKMGETAVNVIKAANYNNVGTVEFIVDKNSNFYFLEVNARIQVEHPITEEVTGVDLVKLQIKIAEGEKLPFTQEDLSQNGHSIECRIYAEDAFNNFMPSAGKIHIHNIPTGSGVRLDSGITAGSEVPIFYDPVLAKLIVWGKTREEARIRMINALKNYVIIGVQTANEFMINVLKHKDFIEGKTFTNFIDLNKDELLIDNENNLSMAKAIAGLVANRRNETKSPESRNSAISHNPWLSIGKWEIAGN